VIGSPFLAGRDRYERVMEGRVDNTHEAAFTHTVRITDPDRAVEVTAVCSPSPAYEVQEASARVLAGAGDPGIAADFPRLAGTRMVGGFTRQVAELCGPHEGAGLFVDAAIEVARLARQVTKMPPAAVASLRPGALRGAVRHLSDGPRALQPAARGARGLHPEEGGAPRPDRAAPAPVPFHARQRARLRSALRGGSRPGHDRGG
jgi:hypothetical protein